MTTTAFAVLAMTLASAAAAQAEPPAAAALRIDKAWARESPPGVPVNAAYLDIHNHGDADTALIGVRSPAFAAAEIHSTVIDGGTASMQKQELVPLPAGKSVSLSPGGHHLMLFQPRRVVKSGDKITLILRFANGDRHAVTAPVRRVAPSPRAPHHDHPTPP